MRKVVRIMNDDDVMLRSLNFDADGGILFDDGMMLVGHHDQDCCESVYADWEHLKDESGFMEADFSDLKIEEFNGLHCGIRVCGGKRKFFVPCYNEQNGYYSDYLEIQYGKVTQVFNGRKKGTPQYRYTLVPIKKIEGCDHMDKIY
jgi:hypothetical protein